MSMRDLIAEKNGVDLDLLRAKAERAAEVDALRVEVDGITLDADRTSLTLMAGAVAAMEDGESTDWIDASNIKRTLTKSQLVEALRQGWQKLTPIWCKPYVGSANLSESE